MGLGPCSLVKCFVAVGYYLGKSQMKLIITGILEYKGPEKRYPNSPLYLS